MKNDCDMFYREKVVRRTHGMMLVCLSVRLFVRIAPLLLIKWYCGFKQYNCIHCSFALRLLNTTEAHIHTQRSTAPHCTRYSVSERLQFNGSEISTFFINIGYMFMFALHPFIVFDELATPLCIEMTYISNAHCTLQTQWNESEQLDHSMNMHRMPYVMQRTHNFICIYFTFFFCSIVRLSPVTMKKQQHTMYCNCDWTQIDNVK